MLVLFFNHRLVLDADDFHRRLYAFLQFSLTIDPDHFHRHGRVDAHVAVGQPDAVERVLRQHVEALQAVDGPTIFVKNRHVNLAFQQANILVAGRNWELLGGLSLCIGRSLPLLAFKGSLRRDVETKLREIGGREAFTLPLGFHFVGTARRGRSEKIQRRGRQRDGFAGFVRLFGSAQIHLDAVGHEFFHAHRLRRQQQVVGVINLQLVSTREGRRLHGHLGFHGPLCVGGLAPGTVLAAIGRHEFDF